MGRQARRIFALLLVGTAIAIVATGCGGGKSSNSTTDTTGTPGFSPYEVKMQQLGQTLGRALIGLGSANKTASAAVVVKDLRQAQKELRSAADQLKNIEPPAKIKTQHELLRTGVLEYADEIDGVIAKFKRGNRQAVFSVTELKGVKDMQKASLAISKAGYVIVLG